MVDSLKLTANVAQFAYDFDPDETDATDIAWKDMRDFKSFLVCFFRTVGTGDLDTFEILANAASDGSGTDVTIKTHALTDQPNAVGDYVFLECTASDLQSANVSTVTGTLRYVTASLEVATTTDEGVVVYTFGNPGFANKGLTTQYVS